MRAHRGGLAAVFLSLIGIGLCGYLAVLHIALLRGELLGGGVCGGAGSALNCHAVIAGPWGSVLGAPLWVWGLIGYLASLNLACFAWLFPEWSVSALTLLTALALVFVGLDAFLLSVMLTKIRYLCLFCLMTYAVNVLLLVVAKRASGQPWAALLRRVPAALGAFVPARGRSLAWMFWMTLALGTVGSVGLHAATTFVSLGSPAMVRRQLREFVAKESRRRPTVSDDPSLGPSNAPVEVVEFSDFFCPVCQLASRFNTIMVANHRGTVRFVFKHFPLDSTCNSTVQRMVHPGACTVAAAGECAHEQGLFWAFHDIVFQQGHAYPVASIERDAARIGLDMKRFQSCMGSGRGLEAVKRDVADGQLLEIGNTPTYIVNGLKLVGIMNPSVFEELLTALREADQ